MYEYFEELDQMNWSARGNVLNQYLRNTSIGTTVKEQCHRLRISSAHGKLEKLHPVVFQVYDSRWRPFASKCIAREATISAHRCTYKADETLKILE